MPTRKSSPAEQVLGDFRNFLALVWAHLGITATPIQYEVADFLQSKITKKRRMVMGFRGMGKSWITSAYVVWRLRRDANTKVLVVSASKSRSDDFSIFTQQLIRDMPILQDLIPRDDQRHSMVAFDVGLSAAAHAPSVKSVGIFGNMTGSRANEIIMDDIEVPNNSQTVGMREKLAKAAGEAEGILSPGGIITILGTPQSEESVYNNLPEKGYQIRTWPAQVPTEAKLESYRGNLAPSVELRVQLSESGDAVDPLRFSLGELDERRAAWGRSAYTLQFMLDTTLSDAERYPLKTSDLIVTGLDTLKAPLTITWGSGRQNCIENIPIIGFTGDKWHKPMFVDSQWTPYEGSVLAIDPSGRGKDETGYAVLKHLHGHLYLVDAGGIKGGYEAKVLMALAMIAKEHQVNTVLVESNFGDGMYTSLLNQVMQRVWPVVIEEVGNYGMSKEARIIDSLEPVLNRHRLIVDESLVRRDLKPALSEDIAHEDRLWNSLFYQMTRITKDRGCLKHDDRLDALAMAVRYWTEFMSRDGKAALRDWKDEQIMKEIDDFKGITLGHPEPRKKLNWVQV